MGAEDLVTWVIINNLHMVHKAQYLLPPHRLEESYWCRWERMNSAILPEIRLKNVIFTLRYVAVKLHLNLFLIGHQKESL